MDLILSRLAPYECLGCNKEGALACLGCLHQYLIKTTECYGCRLPSDESLTCSSCLLKSRLYRARAAVVYDGLAKDLTWRLKSSGTQAAACTMAQTMLPLLAPRVSLIVPIPTASSRIRQRGYDQARLVAKQLSKLSGVPWSDCLGRSGQAHQVGADRQARLNQLDGSFFAKSTYLLKDSHVLVVDDVITTGATIDKAADILDQAGAASVEALAFARPRLLK